MSWRNELNYIRKMYRKDNKLLNAAGRRTQAGRVNLHWWSPEYSDGRENIGDYLSLIVTQYLLTKKGLSLDSPIIGQKHLYAIGSIIQGGAQDATIWGSGLKHGNADIPWLAKKTRHLDIRLVRGPKTREVLLKAGFDCPSLYGDPALLLPLIYQPKSCVKTGPLVILHHATQHQIAQAITPLTTDYRAWLDRLVQATYVISSSLHGIILAEAYGIPAVLLADRATEHLFKYQDYYESTGRAHFPLARSVKEAHTMTPCPIPDFSTMQAVIEKSFPYDLWLGGEAA